MSTRIIVKNLPKEITKEKLVDHIKKTIPTTNVTDCNLKFTRDGIFRRFAFVGFTSEEDAALVKSTLHGTFINATKILTELARDVADHAQVRPWSKYSVINIQKKEKDKKADKKDENVETIQVEEKKEATGFVIKMKGLSGPQLEKAIKEFFKPLKPVRIRVPRNAQKRPIGVAFAEFSTEKDVNQAMGRNKNYINGKKIFLKKSNEELENDAAVNPPPWELKAQDGKQHEVEDIGDSGRLFVRNLYFGVTEEELEEVFGKFGPIAELTLPVDSLTKKVKGFAHVVFVFPEHALKAYTALDYTSLNGRLMHILPGRENTIEEDSNENSAYKKKKDLQQKANSSSGHNWNSLFLGANAVADAMAARYNTDKSDILDDGGKGSLGVRMALGETQIVSETRQFLISNQVSLDCFSQAAGKRSKTVLLVKNLPSGVKHQELKGVFSKHGTVKRVLMPPMGITAIVEYQEPFEAKIGFAKLNFSKFRSIPLYLEWAPMGIFAKPSETAAEAAVKEEGIEAIEEEAEKKRQKEEDVEMEEEEGEEEKEEENVTEGNVTEENVTEEKSQETEISKETDEKPKPENEDEPEDGATIFVKNLNFKTTDEDLFKHFEKSGKLYSASVAKRKDAKRPGEILSMGYGFVQYMTKKAARETLKNLQNSSLDGHNLELKMSDRGSKSVQGRKQQKETKQKATKILVRNVPFEAKKKELEELFKVFGELKFVRLPKKLQGTGPHRGFAFVDFLTKQDAKRAFDALCHSTHLYGRRLVLEWAEEEESLEDLRRKTAQHFSNDGPKKKVTKLSLKNELSGGGGDDLMN